MTSEVAVILEREYVGKLLSRFSFINNLAPSLKSFGKDPF